MPHISAVDGGGSAEHLGREAGGHGGGFGGGGVEVAGEGFKPVDPLGEGGLEGEGS